MDESPFTGAFPHQHQDPRGLRERIDAQLRDRIAEAVDLFALTTVVERHKHAGQPAPDNSSSADRREFEEMALSLLAHLRRAFDAPLTDGQRAAVAGAERPAPAGRERLLAAQVSLARQLPDYWQQFECHAAAFPAAGRPADDRPGWLARLFPGGARHRAEPDRGG